MIAVVTEAIAGQFDWGKLVDYGLTFGIMGLVIAHLLSQNKELRAELKELHGAKEKLQADGGTYKEAMLREALTALNKTSFVLETAPLTLKQHVSDAIKQETENLSDQIERIITKQK